MIEKLKDRDWLKTGFAITGIFTVTVIIFFVIYLVKSYVSIDVRKVNAYLNSKFLGSVLNLVLMYITIFFFDSMYPGHTISTIMDVDKNSSPEDKKNATYFLCSCFISTAWIISYQ